MTKTSNLKHYSVVIPVYNSSRVLSELQQRIEQVFALELKRSYEIIFVDDGSPNPDTWPALEELVGQGQHTRAIRLTRNFGQHAALLCGLAHAEGEQVITMDDDLQHAPEDIPLLVAQQEHDVVIGQFPEKKHSRFRNLGSAFKAYFDRVISGKPREVKVSTFCLIRRNIAFQMVSIGQTQYPLLSSLIFYVTRDVVGVPVQHSPRREGKSGYSLKSLIKLFSHLLLNNPQFILRYVLWAGGLLALFSIAGILLLAGVYLFRQDFPGWFFLGLGLLFSNGILLLVVGFLGLTLSRLAPAAREQKPYLVRQHIY